MTEQTERYLDYYQNRIKEDDEAVYFLLLCAISKDTNDPQNIFMRGSSGIGKTYVTTNVLDLFPPDDVWMLGGLSRTALVHSYGLLMKKDGVEIDLTDKPTIQRVKAEMLDAQPLQQQNEYHKQLKEWNEIIRESYYLVDMQGKILVFLDAPHPETFETLLPILSHDKEEISYRFTDKTSKGQLRTSHVKIRGWPAAIFCTTQQKWLQDFSTRCFTITPKTSDSKIRAALELIGRDFCLPRKDNEKEMVILKCFLEKLHKMLKERSLSILVPFSAYFAKNVPIYKERVMRDFKHLLTYISLNAFMNYQNRPELLLNNSKYILATREDFAYVMKMFQYCEKTTITGLSGHIIDVFEKVMVPLKQFTYKDLVEKAQEILDYPISSSTFYVYVRELAKLGWVDEEPDPNDKRKKIVTIIKKEKNLLSSLIKEFPVFFGEQQWNEWLNALKKLSYENGFASNTSLCGTPMEVWGNGTEDIYMKHYGAESFTEKLLETKGLSTNNLKPEIQTTLDVSSPKQAENSYIRQYKIIPVESIKSACWANGLYDWHTCGVCGYEKMTSWQAETFKNGKVWLCDDCVELWQKQKGE